MNVSEQEKVQVEPTETEQTHIQEETIINEQTEIPESEVVGEEVIEEIDPIVQLTAEKEALADQLLRLQAEMQNMRRIHTRERQDAAKYRSQSLATHLLDVVDNLERALATEVTSEDGQALKKGVEMVYQQFVTAFEKENIQVINPEGQVFDPNFHQAVSVLPAAEGMESDHVLNVLQKGYQLSERVLRPAMVIVSE